MASVHRDIRRPDLPSPGRGGHLVLVTGYEDDRIHIRNPPDMTTRQGARCSHGINSSLSSPGAEWPSSRYASRTLAGDLRGGVRSVSLRVSRRPPSWEASGARSGLITSSHQLNAYLNGEKIGLDEALRFTPKGGQ
jgi:hypothetical protein